jgi:hypothetical protein
MWIGRDTYDPADLEEAISVARSERVNATSDYLLGVPLLANYLEAGLDKLGSSEERSQPASREGMQVALKFCGDSL